MSVLRQLLLKRSSDKCTGSEQMCETGTDSLNTLAICLAVIIPVVVAIAVIAFFVVKAYRRNKKEALEDDDPDFNVDNIMLPEYDHNYGYKPHGAAFAAGPGVFAGAAADSTDSFGNPFNEKYAGHPSQMQLNPPAAPDGSTYHMTTSANAINLPFGDSKEELDQYSRNLGLDFHEFNYPIKKMNTAGGRGSPGHSRETSFSSPQSRQLTGYAVNPSSTQSSPLKHNVNASVASSSNIGKVKSNLGTRETSAASVAHTQQPSVASTDRSLQYHPAAETFSADEKEEEHDEKEGPFADCQEPRSRLQSLNSASTKPAAAPARTNANLHGSTPSSTSPVTSSIASDSHKNQSSSHTTIANDADDTAIGAPQIIVNDDYDVQSKPVGKRREEPSDRDEVPNFKDLAEKETPLSPEEEEQLNRMKSIYQVYFSRDGSVKRKDTNPNITEGNLPPLPTIQFSHEENEAPVKAENQPTEGKLSAPENDDDFRASVSSSVYLPVNDGGLNHSNSTAGQFAHQQLGKIIQNEAVDQTQQQRQQQRQQPYPQQYQQYPDQFPQQYPQQFDQQYQQYHQQQQQYTNNFPPNQQQYQQYYQQYPQMYQQYPSQQYGYPANQRAQPYAGVQKPLPALEKLPLPHQLNKRTSTLESFTTFTAQSHRNPVTVPAIPIDQSFNPIDHVNWGQPEGTVPSPSQIRNSISVFNPVGLSNKSNTFVSKGTAKERVRELQRQQTEGFASPHSPTLSGPLYGFYDNVVERPHGAENLIPKSGSQADLRRQMDNANV